MASKVYGYQYTAIKLNSLHNVEQLWGTDPGGDPIYFRGKLDLLNDNKISLFIGIEGIYGDTGDNTFIGSNFSEKIVGNEGSDILFGNGGDDQIFGGVIINAYNYNYDYRYGAAVDGTDYLHGGDGNDMLDGGGANDFLWGDAGNDKLIGGIGDDTLYGGSGGDIFQFSRGDGLDKIMDFSSADHDAILLKTDSFGFRSVTPADYVVIGNAAPDAAHGYFIANENGIWWDPDGSGSATATQIAVFSTPATGISVGDFLFA